MAYAGWARALARRLVGDPDMADDLVQETLVASWKHPPSLDAPLRPWLATVIRNLARTRHRGAARAERRKGAAEEIRPPAASPSPEEALAALEAQRRLSEAVGKLSEPYRHTVILRYVEELSSAEIARAQGIPEGTVRWRLKTGLDQLRQSYLEEAGPDWRRALVPLAGAAPAAAPPPASTSTGSVRRHFRSSWPPVRSRPSSSSSRRRPSSKVACAGRHHFASKVQLFAVVLSEVTSPYGVRIPTQDPLYVPVQDTPLVKPAL